MKFCDHFVVGPSAQILGKHTLIPAGRDRLSEIMSSKGLDRRAVKVCLLGLLALEGRPQRGRVYKILGKSCVYF